MDRSVILLAGATGDLGGRIARELRGRGAPVRALVRAGSDATRLRAEGVEVVTGSLEDRDALARACEGVACVVSTVSGLREVIVEGQGRLLDAAVGAGVPRFIPSDFAIDFTRLVPGGNRNLDLRREFQARLDAAPIAATSILNGMFTELLRGAAPVILFRFHRVLYWGDADQVLDFTTVDDTAAFTAAAALDPSTPRWLRIAGDSLSARGLADAARDVTGQEFRLLRAGGLGRFNAMIRLTRALTPDRGEVFPPWQGMQYMRDMFSGLPRLRPLDNGRYPELRWTPVREVIAQR